ncbi:hypothetical protein [Chryseobacterium sp. BLS98]|uniref:hypothetical protein n=1 Tax=Chryseobacterium sp. BLS98 TaxID=885586 RepID=UPI000ACF45C5|nr:hypothetical protein [Chryseobacterium sp. BLS98]
MKYLTYVKIRELIKCFFSGNRKTLLLSETIVNQYYEDFEQSDLLEWDQYKTTTQ